MTFLLPILTMQVISATTLQSTQINYKPTLLSSFNLTQPVEGDVAVEKVITTWGQEGTWRWGIHGGYAEELNHNENDLILLGVEFDYFIADELSLDIGINLIDVTQTGDDTDGFNFTLQLRWHAIAKEDWSFFVEGGVGLLFTEHNVPTDGSDFNFTPQVGLGFSFDANDSARWLIGLRWHHISNANTHRTNPGRDSLMLWVGMTFPF
jgi:lipid A 3-O-deacylase